MRPPADPVLGGPSGHLDLGHGRHAIVGAALDAMAADATELYEQVVVINTGYLDGEHPFPDRTHLSVLFATFQLELFDLIIRWVGFAKTEIAGWPTTQALGMTDRTDAILHCIKERRSVLDQPGEMLPTAG